MPTVFFTWGYVTSMGGGAKDNVYSIGDEIAWGIVSERVPTWTWFDESSANVGDPDLGRVMVLELALAYPCEQCGKVSRHPCIEITSNTIVNASWRADRSDLPITQVEYLTFGATGWEPRPDLESRPLSHLRDAPRRVIRK
jgi:hypothetical protein